jgi:DNA-binding NtrC family response regulator
MKKIILVEDNRNFRDAIEMVVSGNFPECKLIIFTDDNKAIEAIITTDKDFDILLLDGDLGFGGHGANVLSILNPEQISKTICCSGNDDFIAQANKSGVSVFLDKGFSGIRISKIHSYILETINKI